MADLSINNNYIEQRLVDCTLCWRLLRSFFAMFLANLVKSSRDIVMFEKRMISKLGLSRIWQPFRRFLSRRLFQRERETVKEMLRSSVLGRLHKTKAEKGFCRSNVFWLFLWKTWTTGSTYLLWVILFPVCTHEICCLFQYSKVLDQLTDSPVISSELSSLLE